MPIKPILLQRRHAELGRIRLGHKAATQSGKTRPAKLGAFRFTSPSERYINDLATLYGGTPRPWDNNGVPEFEVFTDAKTMPVIAVKGGLSQWMETWSGGGCVHRCDGEVNQLTNELCNPDDPAHRDAKPTTRLSVMLPELEAIGVWRLESHGWNAAAEIPAVAEMAQFVGDLVPAHLNLVERRSIKDGQTSRFVVPVLDLQIGTARLREIVAEKSGTASAALAGAEQHRALEAGQSSDGESAPGHDTSAEDRYARPHQLLAEATDLDRLVWIWDTAKDQGLLGTASADTPERDAFVLAWKARAHEIKAATEAATQSASAAEPADGAAADTMAAQPAAGNDDADAVWQTVVAGAADRGLGTEALLDDFKERMGGLLPDEATAAEMRDYLTQVDSDTAVPA